jgi:uncharacterized protein (DUF302 family)
MEVSRTVPSVFNAKDTMDKLEAEVRSKGMTVFARIDHAAGARDVGLPLRPTEVLIFGNARAGTLVMQSNQIAGLDLPLKALVWEDADGKAWLSYDEPKEIGARYGLDPAKVPVLHAMSIAIEAAAKVATTMNVSE